ncbi:MAG: HlyD family efflux transporter periplasmic adaptor subunit [Hydrococcus sp. SU_1_0]|nr:HlyD family efflux transporter periplasmic adaptor subunit [Hydrococcus sp. SU_1_0]
MTNQLKIIGTAQNGQEAIALVESLQPDVVLIDLEMPEMDGVSATEIIVKRFPECKVLVLSSHEDGAYLQNALRAGAIGYLIKGSSAEELTNAIASVRQGFTQLSPGLLQKVLIPEVEVVPDETELPPATTNDSNWSESTREGVETLPRVSLRALLYVLIGLTVVMIPWITFSKVDEIGTARGKLEPKGKIVRLDAPVTGTIMSIKVREGDKVTPGQKLVELESELVNSELNQQLQKLQGQQNQFNQLELVKNQQAISLQTQKQQNQAQQFEKEALIAQAKENFSSLKANYSNQLAEKQAQIDQAQGAIKASQSAHKIAKIKWRIANEKMPRYQDAYQQGGISQDRLAEAKQAAQESKESINQTQAEIAQAQSRYQEQQQGYGKLRQQTAGEINQADLRYQEQQRGLQSLVETNNLAALKIEEGLKNTEAQIVTLKGEIAQTESLIKGFNYQLQQRTVYSPIKGTVFELPIAKPGAVVQPGQTIAHVAPENVPLVLRAKMSSDQSGFLKVGLPVKLKFDAYPFQDYGIVAGHVTWISPDSRVGTNSSSASSSASSSSTSSATATTTPEEFYELEVKLAQNYIQHGDRQILLTPGQTAAAEIVIRQRRLADIFLAPFKSLKKGGSSA